MFSTPGRIEVANSQDPYFLLIYDFSDDYLEKRPTYRKRHVELVESFVDKGYLILGGALENPSDRAYLCFQCPNRSTVEAFVRDDPYVLNGIVLKHEIRDWQVVVGTACSNPISSKTM
jgi:uncharacterized protein YciI